MGKFTIQWNGAQGQSVPEDSGWTWVTESISEPAPRYIFAKVAGADGYVDLSKAASGSLKYDSRTITVTFAKFKHGSDGWMDDAVTLTNNIKTGFGYGFYVYLFPKTIATEKYRAYGFDWDVSRDGIIQYLKLTFKCHPIGVTITTS